MIYGLSYDEAVLASAVIGLVGYVALRHPERFLPALEIALDNLRTLAPMIVLAIMAATFLGKLIPSEVVRPLIGSESGLTGILVASAMGAIIPGGPMITFPLVTTFALAGAGTPQLVALISGWSVVALHRLISLEAPLMGRRFVIRRLSATILLAPLSGVIAAAILEVVS